MFGIKLIHGLDDRHGHGPRQRRLGGGHLQLGQQLPLLVEASQLDGGAAEIDADQLSSAAGTAIVPGAIGVGTGDGAGQAS